MASCYSTKTRSSRIWWRAGDLFNANFDVLLYDLTSIYFEINASDVPEGDKRRHGYSWARPVQPGRANLTVPSGSIRHCRTPDPMRPDPQD
jgi:hypothetical protein